MIYIKGKTGLILPKQTGEMSKKREMTPQAIEQWRSQLPLSDIAASAKSMYFTLLDSHQAPISYKERFEILSLLRPTLRYICQSLQKFYDSQEVLTQQQRPIADLENSLNFEMLNSYKLVIEEAYEQFFSDQRIIMSSFQNALTLCTKIIFNAYEQHRPAPDGIWLELHALYKLAESKNLVTKSLKKYLTWQCRFNTLADIYKHCLLFSIANPNHLRRAQIVQSLYAIESWAPLLLMKTEDSNDSCLFIVDPHQDSPPRYSGLYPKPPFEGYFLNLEHINDRLSKLLVVHTNGNFEKMSKQYSSSELALSVPYIESILNAWRSLRERAHKRIGTQGHINVCLGISASHWFVRHQIPFQTNENDSDMVNIDLNIDSLPHLQPHSENDLAKHEKYLCELINQSEKGYCLKWPDEAPIQLQTGEIIGLEIEIEPNSGKVWSIGTIRWLKNESDNSIFIGVELLSLEALAVETRLADTTSPYSIPTLVFPEIPEKNIPMRLIAPPLPFKTGNEIELEHNNHVYSATLQKVYSTTASYQEFGLHFAYQALVFPQRKVTANSQENVHPVHKT